MEGIAWCFESFTLLADQRLLMSEGLPVRLGGRALDILIALVESHAQVNSAWHPPVESPTWISWVMLLKQPPWALSPIFRVT